MPWRSQRPPVSPLADTFTSSNSQLEHLSWWRQQRHKTTHLLSTETTWATHPQLTTNPPSKTSILNTIQTKTIPTKTICSNYHHWLRRLSLSMKSSSAIRTTRPCPPTSRCLLPKHYWVLFCLFNCQTHAMCLRQHCVLHMRAGDLCLLWLIVQSSFCASVTPATCSDLAIWGALHARSRAIN